jgi:hypothetical protein
MERIFRFAEAALLNALGAFWYVLAGFPPHGHAAVE